MSPLQRVCARIAVLKTHRNLSHVVIGTQSSSGEHPNQPNKLFQGKTLCLERCFSLTDVHSFCQLCHITDPIHLDPSDAQHHGFSACIVPELMYAGLFPAIIGTHFPGSIYVSQRLEFKSPVLLGDCLIAEVKASHMRSVRDKYRVEFATSCWKKEGNVLAVEGIAIALLPSLFQEVTKC